MSRIIRGITFQGATLVCLSVELGTWLQAANDMLYGLFRVALCAWLQFGSVVVLGCHP